MSVFVGECSSTAERKKANGRASTIEREKKRVN